MTCVESRWPDHKQRLTFVILKLALITETPWLLGLGFGLVTNV